MVPSKVCNFIGGKAALSAVESKSKIISLVQTATTINDDQQRAGVDATAGPARAAVFRGKEKTNKCGKDCYNWSSRV